MKILAFSDLHLDTVAAEKLVSAAHSADVVIGAGDFGIRQQGLSEFVEMLGAIEAPTLLVPGNHDDIDGLRHACAGWQGASVLHGEAATVCGIHFFGLGYETPRVCREDWSRHLDDKNAVQMLQACPRGGVLITHTPPLGVADMQADGSHEGSAAIRAIVEKRQPRLHVCGHIHHSGGVSGKIGACAVHNVGPVPTWLSL